VFVYVFVCVRAFIIVELLSKKCSVEQVCIRDDERFNKEMLT
jgi:hypothetical protein